MSVVKIPGCQDCKAEAKTLHVVLVRTQAVGYEVKYYCSGCRDKSR